MRRAAIITVVRTPIGRYGGALAKVRPDDLAAMVIRRVVERSGITRPPATMSASAPPARPAGTTAPWRAWRRRSRNRLRPQGRDLRQHDRLAAHESEDDPAAAPYSMGETAENLGRKYEINREDQDRFALWSRQKCAAVKELGLFDNEIVPVEIPQRKSDPIVVDTDEHPRPDAILRKLAKLKLVFARDDKATVTAGDSSGINDGAAAVLVVKSETANRLGMTPMAYIGHSASAGVDPAIMGIGPVPATRKALARAGIELSDIDIIELNEAFAAQSLACIRELGIEEANINPKGGAIAVGHPLGCTGARLAVTLVHEMVRTKARRGLATLCIGVGQGLATLIDGAESR